ncbi:PDZ and LIM domain protein Zasp isoform X2 [Trichoplusia ni]|uniref:PDZ and LIM domain protein Zasp isoform X2 n=1 Tax=Trichoplusia ni TaxID=7111 RepID=A0A7E5VNU0_TRINI|nr:PDZ and LIM domain protein Zasp isoform X2 [Trichoplusia ni]
MAQLITVRLNKADQQPLGFRLQGGKDFGTPLVVQKVNGGSAAERAGLQAGDALIRVNTTDVYLLRHQEAQDAIRAAGGNLELTVQRGGGTWRPSVTPTGSLPRPGSRSIGSTPTLVTNTSLKATPQPSRAFGSGHNNVAKPFGYMNGNDSVKSIVNKQYNTPVNMYSDKTIAETLSAQTEVLAGGVLGVNFKKNEKTYDAEKSAVFKVLQEEQNDPEPVVEPVGPTAAPAPVSGLRHVQAPITRPDAPVNNTGGLPPGQNICEECERLITGVFVRIKDKNLHVECFKCSTCGTSLKNQGYYNLNGKLYCDIHAKLVARNNPPAPNLEPVTVPPGSRIPSNTYSTPLPPLATNNYTNGSSSLFSPSSNLSGPKPFGSSIGSAYSPSLSPRSAPMSPARPVTAPAPAPAPLVAPAPAPVPPPAAPFAPTQNVKSIVWPPPANPSDDEPPKYDPSMKPAAPACGKEIISQSVNKIIKDTESNIANMQQQMEQFVTSSKQIEEFSSSVSYASAAMSSMTATTKSESIAQSKQSQIMQESTSQTIQSYSQESSKCQSKTLYEAQTCPSKGDNPVSKIEKVQTIQSKEDVQSKISESKIVKISDPPKVEDKRQVIQNTESNIECASQNVRQESNTNKPVESHEVVSNNEQVSQTKEAAVQNEVRGSQVTAQLENKYNEKTNIQSETSKLGTMQTCNNPVSQQNVAGSLVDALTTAPDRPYSPLPQPCQPISITGQPICEEKPVQHLEEQQIESQEMAEINRTQLPAQQSPMFMQEKRAVSPIPPIKTYNPPEKVEPPVPMPAETKPYIPPDFKIVIEPKTPREAATTPLVEALTTAPDRPFTPITTYEENPNRNQSISRGSLRDALTIAPDRPYSPFGTSTSTSQTNQYMTSTISLTETNLSDIVKPIATQTTTQMTDHMHSEFSAMQNTCKLQSSSEMSAFRPVPKQVFPPPQPEEFCMLQNFPPISNELKTSFTQATKTKQETSYSESMMMQQSSLSTTMASQGYSSVKTAQNYFEQLDKKESLTSTAVRSKSGLHKPDSIPPYQRNFEQLPSQRGISPDMYNAPAVLQRPVTPTTNPPTRPKEKSLEPNPQAQPQSHYVSPQVQPQRVPQIKTPVQQPPVQFRKETPITMTFQPVTDDNFMRVTSSPVPRSSRPTTPSSMINKPAPIIPHYQMNLVTVEHLAPESHLYEPSSREGSRSPTPKPRSRSPAQGPPPNPLKAQAPRIKDPQPQYYSSDSYVSQDATNLQRQHEMDQRNFQTAAEIYNTGATKSWGQSQQSQPCMVKEQKHSNVGYKSENYTKGDMKFKEDSLVQENYGQRQMQSQNVIEQGNTTVHTTRKTFEEFERKQSAKVVEIRKGGSSFSGAYEENVDSNIRPSNINPKQVFPPPMMSLPPTQQSSSLNLTNQNMQSANRTIDNYDPKPSISGANLGPVCDPTPSTGSSVGAAARGKTFGVSSAPKRGRGVLNKAALPGSRVPLCASCNGHIRGPFITALGRIWCPEHFICVNATCRRPLQDIGFVEENGQLYCEFCFEQYIAPACDKCHAKIKGDCLNAIGKHYHPECFNCVYCGKLFGNNPFFLEDGLPYCEADWNDLFTTKCFACGFPVEAGDRWVEALNNNYHSQCFNCTVCKKNLEGQSFFAKGGRPFCKTHAR